MWLMEAAEGGLRTDLESPCCAICLVLSRTFAGSDNPAFCDFESKTLQAEGWVRFQTEEDRFDSLPRCFNRNER